MMINQTIIDEFENMMHLFSISLPKKKFVTEKFPLKKNPQNVQIEKDVQKCIQQLILEISIKHVMNKTNILKHKKK